MVVPRLLLYPIYKTGTFCQVLCSILQGYCINGVMAHGYFKVLEMLLPFLKNGDIMQGYHLTHLKKGLLQGTTQPTSEWYSIS